MTAANGNVRNERMIYDSGGHSNGGPPRGMKREPLGVDYNVQDTITSVGSIVLNLGKKPPKKRKRICPDGGHMLSILYTVIICILGVSFPVREALQEKWLTTYTEGIFLAYIYGMSLAFILFVEIYLLQMTRKHGHEVKKDQDKPQILVKDKNTDKHSVYDTVNGHFTAVNSSAALRRRQSMIEAASGVEIYILEPTSEWDEPLPHHTTLYVRFGAIIFGVGNMVYDGLLLKTMQSKESACLPGSFVWPHYVHLVFLLTQTYFIFKHPQVKITFAKPLARLGFMHLFATNVCVWFRTVIRETLESFLHHAEATSHGLSSYDTHGTTHSTPYGSAYDTHSTTHKPTPYGESYNGSGIGSNGSWINGTLTTQSPVLYGCDWEEDILTEASPYLFPCVLEYSLLAAAVMFSMYSDVGTHSKSSGSEEDAKQTKEQESHLNSFITEINFHKSHKGMFGGILVIAATVVSIILFYSYTRSSLLTTQLIYHSTMIGLYSLILFGTLVATIQLQSMKFNRNLTSSVDDLMLVMAMGGLFLFELLKFLPLVNNSHHTLQVVLQMTESCLALVVSVLQTWFLIDGMRRMSHNEAQYFKKPGRGAVMFLLLTNVALWLFRTFHMKEVEVEGHIQEAEYGYLAWQLILHALVPLVIFYHFHCSACLAHIWSGAYSYHANKPISLTHATSTTDGNVSVEIDAATPTSSRRISPAPIIQPSPPKHIADANLVPDRIIQFKRHGKAPPASRTSIKTIVESVDSPLDTGRSLTWPRLNPMNGGEDAGNVPPVMISHVIEANGVGLAGAAPSIVWMNPGVENADEEKSHEKVVKWQLHPHDSGSDEESA